jgi:hypothetical protein
MKSIIRNFTTAFFAGIISSILFLIYLLIFKKIGPNDWVIYFLFIAMIVMGICSILGFVGLLILSFFSNIFNWSEGIDYTSKILLVLALYLPLFFIMKEIDWLHSFWYWSLIGTLTVISFDYKSMFAEHFTVSKSNLLSNNH